MKLVREHINEKFTEDSDPIRDMSIGAVNTKQNFKSEKEMFDFLSYILPSILKTDKIPEDILLDPKSYIDYKYSIKLSNYVEKYFYINNEAFGKFYLDFRGFHLFLKDKYPYLKSWIAEEKRRRNESVNEKFTEDSDPIRDMGIGLYVSRNFNNKKEFINFLIKFIPAILKTEEIPEDILFHGGFINNNYFDQIVDFLIKYKYKFKYNLMYREKESNSRNSIEVYSWPFELKTKLKKMGFATNETG